MVQVHIRNAAQGGDPTPEGRPRRGLGYLVGGCTVGWKGGGGCIWSTGVRLGVQLVNLNVIRAHDGAILPPLSKCGTERSYNTHKKLIVSYSFTHTPHIHWSFVVYNYEQTTNSVLEEARILFFTY
jgi:hypothetical protein